MFGGQFCEMLIRAAEGPVNERPEGGGGADPADAQAQRLTMERGRWGMRIAVRSEQQLTGRILGGRQVRRIA